jgi:hypothetical protein
MGLYWFLGVHLRVVSVVGQLLEEWLAELGLRSLTTQRFFSVRRWELGQHSTMEVVHCDFGDRELIVQIAPLLIAKQTIMQVLFVYQEMIGVIFLVGKY